MTSNLHVAFTKSVKVKVNLLPAYMHVKKLTKFVIVCKYETSLIQFYRLTLHELYKNMIQKNIPTHWIMLCFLKMFCQETLPWPAEYSNQILYKRSSFRIINVQW